MELLRNVLKYSQDSKSMVKQLKSLILDAIILGGNELTTVWELF